MQIYWFACFIGPIKPICCCCTRHSLDWWFTCWKFNYSETKQIIESKMIEISWTKNTHSPKLLCIYYFDLLKLVDFSTVKVSTNMSMITCNFDERYCWASEHHAFNHRNLHQILKSTWYRTFESYFLFSFCSLAEACSCSTTTDFDVLVLLHMRYELATSNILNTEQWAWKSRLTCTILP